MQTAVSASPGRVLYALTFLADDLIAHILSITSRHPRERRKTLDLTLNGETVP
jgi:hypothetical protein